MLGQAWECQPSLIDPGNVVEQQTGSFRLYKCGGGHVLSVVICSNLSLTTVAISTGIH